MSLTQSSFFGPSVKFSYQKCNKTKVSFPIKCSFGKSGKTKVPMFHNDHENKCLTKNVGKTAVLINGYPYFTSPHHPLESELPRLFQAETAYDDDCGIGIVKFFEGKNIFITGATDLVGKAFVEKLLRSTSVGKIYLQIKAEDKAGALERLRKEIINSELFKCLHEKHGNSYQEFVREKLIPIVGNICEPNLGMDSKSAEAIKKDVDVIIQSAASTTLNERYDVLLDMNVNAPQRLMRFAKTCSNLKLFVHISTAYVSGRKEGLIQENPLIMGENGKNEDDDISSSSFPRLDLADEISLAMKSCSSASPDYEAVKDLKKLGQERANMFGWYNSYHMTKALAEMALNEMRGDTPLLIIRPTVIESSYKEPFPGWIQGNRVFDPVIISYGKGQLPAYLDDPDIPLDVIPLDMVVNSTIAAIAKHGMTYKSHLNVYQVASGVVNPLKYSEAFELFHEYFNSTSFFGSKDISKIKLCNDFDNFSKYSTRDEISKSHNKMTANAVGADEKTIERHEKQLKAKVAYAEQMCKTYGFSGFFKGRFDTGNIRRLLREMSKEEKQDFDIDVTNINWRKYFLDVHIPGLRKHVLNNTRMSI